jgi:hypothetical protein
MIMALPRRVQPELLDTLPADDPQAQRSRRDLRRLNRAMATMSLVLRALDDAVSRSPPKTILELGAGDGTMMLRIARRRAADWPDVKVTLLDRQNLIDTNTLESLRALAWMPEVHCADVSEWLERPSANLPPAYDLPGQACPQWDIVFANLFVHHFSAQQLSALLAGIAARCRAFICCEPRRAAISLVGSHLVGLIGANAVTREDAVLSVHAGFRDREISAVWPDHRNWRLHEYSAGLFSHVFVAVRN